MSSSDQHTTNLPPITKHITTHDPKIGTSIIQSSSPIKFTPFIPSKPAINVGLLYSTSRHPASLNAHTDLHDHKVVLSSGTAKVVPPQGSSFRICDIAPGYTSSMHRTVSLDYGVIIEGMLELVCDGKEEVGREEGEVRVMKRGDVSVLRGTMHAWRNPREREWARIAFVVLDAESVEVKGEKLGEVWN